jgi:hypothetical protein
MGDMADDILNGDVDGETGEWIGNGQGFPRTGYSKSTNPLKKGGLHLIGKHCTVKHNDETHKKCEIISAKRKSNKNWGYQVQIGKDKVMSLKFRDLIGIH